MGPVPAHYVVAMQRLTLLLLLLCAHRVSAQQGRVTPRVTPHVIPRVIPRVIPMEAVAARVLETRGRATLDITRRGVTMRGVTVRGTVRDSIGRVPLAGALVQLVAADSVERFAHTEVADSLGDFAFRDVPAGRYTLGFYHPMLDSLGLDPLLRDIAVGSDADLRADLAVPSASTVRRAICGPTTAENSGAVVMGLVRDAATLLPASDVTVSGEWMELTLGTGGFTRRSPRRLSTTLGTGWFALCNMPSPGTIMLMARRGADSTDVVELHLGAEPLVRRELYLGVAHTVARMAVPRDSAVRMDSVSRAVSPAVSRAVSPAVLAVHVGDGRLSGTVFKAEGHRPLINAEVSIVNGPRTRTNERGEWTLSEAPTGTRTLEVRAVGLYPDRRTVDVIADAAPIRVELTTIKAVLDTMKVVASRALNLNLLGFQERRRQGNGRFLSITDLARRQVYATTDIFRNMPGVYFGEGSDVAESIMMRGTFSDRCAPSMFINGQAISDLSGTDLDAFVRPNEIAAIEIYSATQVPPQFQVGLSGCGSIVIWTR